MSPGPRFLIALLIIAFVCITTTTGSGLLNVTALQERGWGVSISYLGSQQIDTNVKIYKSQVHQDAIIDSLFRQKTNGYFVDLASNDALWISNTVFLESVRHWRGLCIEINPAYEAGLMSRKCTYVKAVVGPETGNKVQFTFQGGCGPACGGIVSDTADNKPNHVKHSITYETVKVQKLLQDLDAPPIIEYISLDIEGMEYQTFKDFDFTKFKFKVLTVERPKSLSDVLKSKGYLHIGGMGGFGETLWIHKDYTSELNLNALRNSTWVKLVPEFDTLIKSAH